MDSVTQKARDLLKQRVEEIDKERGQIEGALRSLASGNGNGTTRKRRARKPEKGGRSAQALRLIEANPGIKIPELAKKMKLRNPNYLYRVVPQLPVERDGKGGLKASETQAA